MTRHGHLHRSAINAIATESTTSAQTTQTPRLAPQKLQRRKYGMMTQHCRQRLNRLRTTLPSHDQLQKRAVLSAHRTTDVNTRDSNIFNGRRFDGHLCDTSLVATLLVVNPSLRHVTRRHVIRHQPIVRNATPRSVEPPSVPGRPLFDRLVPISSSRCCPHHDDHRLND